MRRRLLYLLSFIFIIVACRAQQSDQAESGGAEGRAVYSLKHYWDTFDFPDSSWLFHPEIADRAITRYIDQLKQVSLDVASSSIKEMMGKAAADSALFVSLFGLYEKYLYDADSPMRDESLYVPVLEAVLEASVLDEVSKIRPAHLLELLLKNRVGELAADFAYTLAAGKAETLYQTTADRLLLFFYDPDCHTCRNVTDQLAASPLVAEWIRNGKLKILAVYPEEDLDAWKNHLSYMPESWINSYDPTVSLINEEIYDLKVMPSLYLLDKDKNVILKDATFNQVENYLKQE